MTIPLHVIVRDGCHRSSRIFSGIILHICDNILHFTLSFNLILFRQFCRHKSPRTSYLSVYCHSLSYHSAMIKLPVKFCTRSSQYILIQRTWFVCIQFCKLCSTGCCLYLMPFQRLLCMCLSGIFVKLICGSTDILNFCILCSCLPDEPGVPLE